jgi:MFS transporter, MHS family, shikimate and dehydroshikimate transport protein
MTSSLTMPVRPRSEKITPGARKAMFAATLGTAIEWYDYALYGIAAGLVISPLFFPDAVGDTGPIIAFATFAVGFIIRPIGGLAIAHMGDKIGRKPALLLTILIMGIATTGIGLLPTAETIGIAAPILLVALRALQGFGAGAELSGALTVAAEYTPESRRGFFTGIINAVGGAGSALAMIAFLAVSAVPEEVLLGGLWRVPFLLSAVLFLVALYIRRRLDETPEYVAAKARNETAMKESVPLKEVFKASPRRVIFAILMWTGHNANTYIVLTFALSYLTNTVGFERGEALWITLIASSVGCLSSPLWGMAGDRFGHKQIFGGVMIFGALFSVPLFMLMNTGNWTLALIGLLIAAGITFGGTSGTAGAVSANLFPARFRFSGIAAAKEINAAVIAGPTPFIAAALVSAASGEPWLAAIFISICCIVTVFSLVALGRGTGNSAVIDEVQADR